MFLSLRLTSVTNSIALYCVFRSSLASSLKGRFNIFVNEVKVGLPRFVFESHVFRNKAHVKDIG